MSEFRMTVRTFRGKRRRVLVRPSKGGAGLFFDIGPDRFILRADQAREFLDAAHDLLETQEQEKETE